jgi:hypothetical protein
MARIPPWLYILFGCIAVVAGVLGVGHAPAGLPKVFWAVVTVAGVASLATSWIVGRRSQQISR